MKHAHAIVLGLVMAFAIRAPSHADPDSSSSSLIVFSSNRSGSWKLWTVCPDGSGLKQLLKVQTLKATLTQAYLKLIRAYSPLDKHGHNYVDIVVCSHRADNTGT